MISTINGPSDNPSIQIPFDYLAPTDINGIGITIALDVVVQGTGHACSTGTSYNSRHYTLLHVVEPDTDYYHPTNPDAICHCTFGG